MASINMNDDRLKSVEAEKAQAIANTENTYNQMINNVDLMYQKQSDAVTEYENKQKQFQQQQTDLDIQSINQQKNELQKNYEREQRGAYTDYQKAIDEYGVQAEKQASAGLRNSGYSESSKITAFTTYQNRYGTARESYQNAVVKYDQDIAQAKLNNSSKLAEIAYNALEKRLTLALDGFQYKNTLIQNKINQLNTVEDRFYNRYRDVINQLNTERDFEEKQREFNESMALQKAQFAWQKAQATAKASSSGSKKSSSNNSKNTATLSSSYDSKSADAYINSVNALYSKSLGLPATSKNTLIKNKINRDFQSGKLTKEDVTYISNKYGF